MGNVRAAQGSGGRPLSVQTTVQQGGNHELLSEDAKASFNHRCVLAAVLVTCIHTIESASQNKRHSTTQKIIQEMMRQLAVDLATTPLTTWPPPARMRALRSAGAIMFLPVCFVI